VRRSSTVRPCEWDSRGLLQSFGVHAYATHASWPGHSRHVPSEHSAMTLNQLAARIAPSSGSGELRLAFLAAESRPLRTQRSRQAGPVCWTSRFANFTPGSRSLPSPRSPPPRSPGPCGITFCQLTHIPRPRMANPNLRASISIAAGTSSWPRVSSRQGVNDYTSLSTATSRTSRLASQRIPLRRLVQVLGECRWRSSLADCGERPPSYACRVRP